MKPTFNKYLLLLATLFLSTFAHLHASEAINNYKNASFSQNISEIQLSTIDTEFQRKAKTTINPSHKASNEKLVFELIEINEGEDEELSFSNKSLYKDYLKLLFVNAGLFQNACKALQKNNYRTQNDSIEPKLRLHIHFQVFII